jgi:antitoxin StbD
MAYGVLSETAVSISDHKKNPMATVAAGEGMAVAVLNRKEPACYCVPARAYEDLMALVGDLELGRIADARLADGQESLRVCRTSGLLEQWLVEVLDLDGDAAQIWGRLWVPNPHNERNRQADRRP